MLISGNTKLAAVLATPIKHSVSPLIHNTAFQALGIDGIYLAFEVGTDGLEEALRAVKTLDLLGVNLSMPNKQLGYTLVDEVSEVAQLVESINTVVHRNGRLIGHNTDGIGFMESLRAEGVPVVGKKMTILGSGGAALSIIAQGAIDGLSIIDVFKRQGPNFEEIKAKLALISAKTSCLIRLLPLEEEDELKKSVTSSDILVNGTNVGMSPEDDRSLITDASWLQSDLVVTDIIYQPRETKLLALARKQGCQTINGLGMLLHQGAAAFELWTGEKMPIDIVSQAIKNI